MNYAKYLLEIAFSGENYSGWQCQPEKVTVQGVIETKLSLLYNTKISVRGVGRTDAGVHALGMTLSFRLPSSPFIPAENLKKALNSILPFDIFVKKIYGISDPDFDPRFDALGKAYTYVLAKENIGPFLNRYSWQVPYEFNIADLIKGSKYLIGTHDFSSFAVALNKTGKNPVRSIYRIDINDFGRFVCITIVGKSFLYKMVRSIAGTLVQCASKNRSFEDVESILSARKRSAGCKTAPANGLFLMKVFYSQEELDDFKLTKLPFEYLM